MNFCSENNDSVHPEILKALNRANKGFAAPYGKDALTAEATSLIKKACKQNDLEVFYCFNGTGANNFALSAVTSKHQSVLCADISHIYNAESTATEALTGCRLFPVRTANGKIILNDLVSRLAKEDNLHFPEVAVLSIAQPTEYGTIYSEQELKDISAFCKTNNLLLHIDGARLFNALAAMNCSLSRFVRICGVDVLTLGGTKSGLMFGEAVIFFHSKRSSFLKMLHKRSMQLASKNRYIAAQFCALFQNDLWKTIAGHTNGLADYFSAALNAQSNLRVVYPVQTNAVFVGMTAEQYRHLSAYLQFYYWDTIRQEARFIFSNSHTRKDVDQLIRHFRKQLIP